MGTRQRNESEDRLTITRSSTRSKTTLYEIKSSLPIPIDLIIEIFLRLPAKSIARCRCVSKLWASILRRPDFTELFFTMSSVRPPLLFSCVKAGELFFFSSPQAQLENPDENSSSLAAKYLMKFPVNGDYEFCGHVRGLVCIAHVRIFKQMMETMPVIYNPTTGQSLNLPIVTTTMGIGVRSFFGYDPIEKQFKILLMKRIGEHQVLTLGSRELSWRMVECSIPHYSLSNGVCINGVLYYKAALDRSSVIICFDVRSEKFKYITIVEASIIRAFRDGTLINYNGKLGLLFSESFWFPESIQLWVLQDAEKQEWSEHTYILPASCQNIVGNTVFRFEGVTRTNEIVLSPRNEIFKPFDVFYYNIERNTITRVGIEGLEAFENKIVYTYLDHVEDVKVF